MTPRSKISDIRTALDELSFVEDELVAANAEIISQKGIIHDLDKDNRRLAEQLEKALSDRDKYQSYAVNLTTRLQVIAENVDSVIREASRSAISEASRLQESRAQARRIAQDPPIHPVRKAAQEAVASRSAALLPEVTEDDDKGDERPLFLRNGRTNLPTNEFR